MKVPHDRWPSSSMQPLLVFLFASRIRPRGLDTSTRSVQPWQHRVRGGFAASSSLSCPQQPGGWSQSAARRLVKRTHGHRQNAIGICRWVHRLGQWTVNDHSKLMLLHVNSFTTINIVFKAFNLFFKYALYSCSCFLAFYYVFKEVVNCIVHILASATDWWIAV